MQKVFYVDSIDSEVIISRRKGSKHLRLTIRSDGKIRLNVPYGISARRAKIFLTDKANWINKHKKITKILQNGDHIGKSHRLLISFQDIKKPKTRVMNNEITIKLPFGATIETSENQKIIRSASERALQKQASILLPQRLRILSSQHNIPYKSVKIKKLKSRWGSCDSSKNISLNNYLIQLDWHLIDYVMLHELAHTKYQHHQKVFWSFLEVLLPDYKNRRETLKTKKTDISQTNF